jgi:hypothetical protein
MKNEKMKTHYIQLHCIRDIEQTILNLTLNRFVI